MKKTLQQFAHEHRMLFWDMSPDDILHVSDEAVIERFLSYGDWLQIQQMEKIFGIKKEALIFKKLANKKRCNLRPETVSFFRDYFSLHA